ncbi:MAG: ABC transporter permease, partial [Candidatus Binataceae bacterium]
MRSWTVWVFLFVIALGFFGAASSDMVVIGEAIGNTYRNAPWVIETYYALGTLLTVLMTTAFVNSAAVRDFEYNTTEVVFSTPIRKLDYLAGRFCGSSLVALIPLLGISVAVLLAKDMPWVDPERWGPIAWTAHWKAILTFAVPNTIFAGAVVFAIAVMMRGRIYSFLGALLLITGYGVSLMLMTRLQSERLAALLDPFAITTLRFATKYWTIADKNRLTIGYSGVLLWNRLIWLLASAVLLLFAYRRFSFAEKSRPSTRPEQEEKSFFPALAASPVTSSFGPRTQWSQFLGVSKLEFKRMVRTTTFIVLVAAALLNCVPALILRVTEGYGNTSFPVTYKVLEIIFGSLYIFVIAIITFFAGALVWEERDNRTDEVCDALPAPEWPTYAAKLAALIGGILVIQLIAMVSGLLVQFFHGYYRFQLVLYFADLFGINLSGMIFLAILAFFIHVVSPNKYTGHFAFIAFVIADIFVWRPLHVGSLMVQFAARPWMLYSDFYGYAPFIEGWIWFTIYWSLFCLLLALASILLWQRGRETRWRSRVRAAGLRFRGSLRVLTVMGAMAFAAVAAWVYYNTEVLNVVRSEYDQNLLQADYEKNYKRYEDQPQPRVTNVKYAIDLFPETRNIVMRAAQTIQNKTDSALSEVHFSTVENYDTDIEVPGATLLKDDRRLGYRIYALKPPMQPGESRLMHFTVKTQTRGFENWLTVPQVVQNGTFFNNFIAPQIGYQTRAELSDPATRRRFKLKGKELMPPLETNCDSDCMDNYISNNSDWVNVESVISTSPNQIAVVPGSLQGEWTSNGVGWDDGADRASNDADVSIVLPKIPYGGFSPVRLQGRRIGGGL